MLEAFASGAILVILVVAFLAYRARQKADTDESAPAGKGGRAPGAQPK